MKLLLIVLRKMKKHTKENDNEAFICTRMQNGIDIRDYTHLKAY
jgi:hypothetical protein